MEADYGSQARYLVKKPFAPLGLTSAAQNVLFQSLDKVHKYVKYRVVKQVWNKLKKRQNIVFVLFQTCWDTQYFFSLTASQYNAIFFRKRFVGWIVVQLAPGPFGTFLQASAKLYYIKS